MNFTLRGGLTIKPFPLYILQEYVERFKKEYLSHHYRWINMDSVLFVGVVDNVDKPRVALFYRICRVSLTDNYLPIGVDCKNVSNFSCG
jgi:hypothetical protein